MRIVCISAANIEVARNNSASVRACELVKEIILAKMPEAEVEIVPLIDFEMKPCRMCGACYPSGRCAHDAAFNQVFAKLTAAHGAFFVVPHYAPLPSKLMMLFEKMQEIAFLGWCADAGYRFPLAQKPVGVIGHGGQETSADTLAYYQRMIVEPVAAALRAVSLQVIGSDAGSPHGAAFAIQSITRRDGSIFVDIQHDWDDVRQRIAPLARHLAAALQPQ